ncbi:MAG TPA: NAD(P)H-dependent glycerol-3-phosphate dehydrogenase [Bacillota bacterium]
MKIGVVGAGGWGTALAKLLTENGHEVSLWAYEKDTADEVNQAHCNHRFLPGITLPEKLTASSDPEQVAKESEVLVFVTPSQWVRSTVKLFKDFIKPDIMIINAAKGIETSTLQCLSTVIREELEWDDGKIITLSGPSHAEEVGRRVPTAAVVASPALQYAKIAQDIFITPYFRVYTNSDRIGVEIGGALKNIFALAAGICEGLGFGDNTKAALVTRALSEMRRLGEKMGAQPLTFSGLSGLGDLYVTSASRHSRNAWAGREIGKGRKVEEVLQSTPMVVEGVPTTKAAYLLGKKYQVELPITNIVYKILYEGYPPVQALQELMSRERRHEIETIF